MRFLTRRQVQKLVDEHGSPLYVCGEKQLKEAAEELLAFPSKWGLTVRYAMKAWPTMAILQSVDSSGLHIDASSGFEVERAMMAGISADHIQLTSQQLPDNLSDLISRGVLFNACSLEQLKAYGEAFSGTARNTLSVRINPGLGSGHSNRTNVGGPSSSFGIWKDYIEIAKAWAKHYGLKITAIHTHIGSGSDPDVWVRVAKMSLEVAKEFPDATRINLGGGFRVGRMPDEKSTDLQECGKALLPAFQQFEQQTGRYLNLEIEPGTFVVARSGVILARVIDIVDTGKNGYKFLKVDSGMTDILRLSYYGAQHQLTLIPQKPGPKRQAKEEVVVVGHCCESGDILTPAPGDPEAVATRVLPKAEIGDIIVIEDTGAYCSSMSAAGYNSFPAAAEVMVKKSGEHQLIRKRQEPKDLWMNEIGLEA